MTIFKTTPDQLLELLKIGDAMIANYLKSDFITEAVHFAEFDQGFFDLMKLWSVSKDPEERSVLINVMKEEMWYR